MTYLKPYNYINKWLLLNRNSWYYITVQTNDYYCFSLCKFFIQVLADGFLVSLSDYKSPQVYRTRLSIVTNFNNVVVSMVLILPLISDSSSPLSKSLGIIPSARTTIGITITFMFHSFFSSLARSNYLYNHHYYYYFYFLSFSHWHSPMVSYSSLSDSKSPQVSRTLLNIIANLNYAVVWMVSTPPLISNSSSPCFNPLVTVPRAQSNKKVSFKKNDSSGILKIEIVMIVIQHI